MAALPSMQVDGKHYVVTGALSRDGERLPLALGTSEGDAVRFRSSQATLLDAMLAELPAVEVDAAFARARTPLDVNSRTVSQLD